MFFIICTCLYVREFRVHECPLRGKVTLRWFQLPTLALGDWEHATWPPVAASTKSASVQEVGGSSSLVGGCVLVYLTSTALPG